MMVDIGFLNASTIAGRNGERLMGYSNRTALGHELGVSIESTYKLQEGQAKAANC